MLRVLVHPISCFSAIGYDKQLCMPLNKHIGLVYSSQTPQKRIRMCLCISVGCCVFCCCFAFPALCSLSEKFRDTKVSIFFYWLFYFFLILLIGLRFEVSPDWNGYQLLMLHYGDFNSQFWHNSQLFINVQDIGYSILNSVANSLDYGIWLPNLVCAIIFCTGLVLFCNRLPNKWLALAVSIPWLVIVFSFASTRQSAAFGLSLIALTLLFDRRNLGFIIYILSAAFFHTSAIVMLFFGIFGTKIKIGFTLVIIVSAYLFFNWFISDRLEFFVSHFVLGELNSAGAPIRLALNCLPAALFLLFKSRFHIDPNLRKFWQWWAIIVLCLIPVMMLSPSNTIVDRFNLYLTPIQLFVCAHLPLLVKGKNQRILVITTILALYATFMYYFFSYSRYAFYYFPYKFYPLEYF